MYTNNTSNIPLSKPKDFGEVIARLSNYDSKTNTSDCPCQHGTPQKTLSVKDAGDKSLVNCFGGHSYEEICKAIGYDSLTYSTNGHKPTSEPINRAQHPLKKVATFAYTDENGKELYIKERLQSDIPKDKVFY